MDDITRILRQSVADLATSAAHLYTLKRTLGTRISDELLQDARILGHARQALADADAAATANSAYPPAIAAYSGGCDSQPCGHPRQCIRENEDGAMQCWWCRELAILEGRIAALEGQIHVLREPTPITHPFWSGQPIMRLPD